ncbi:WW domain-containing protein C2F3.14c [Ceratocystis platani]|uniref:WW domain-containing protein C2F3.14c n=1 Tax=Ceratocystis fimbriata f. sp. platani TaxID=88771 RepID=A0A0F8B8S0_CERFI|nr:WW domain-containing protein C2F3.14c [Ceratocystis platani]
MSPDIADNVPRTLDKVTRDDTELAGQAQSEGGVAKATTNSLDNETQTGAELKAAALLDELMSEEACRNIEGNGETADADRTGPNSPANNEEDAPLSNEPPLPNEPVSESINNNAPLPPSEPTLGDDGWDYRWDPATNQYVFFNRFTGVEQLENPRLQESSHPHPTQLSSGTIAGSTATDSTDAPPPPPEILGYNPAIHGDYDPNAWYAKLDEPQEPGISSSALHMNALDDGSQVAFNRFNGHFQTDGLGSERYSGDAKAKRQLHSYFDVDAAANAHQGRSLKAERQGQRLSKNELKQFKEKRKARKEEKRRAWLRD